jgi:hypothetical protein
MTKKEKKDATKSDHSAAGDTVKPGAVAVEPNAPVTTTTTAPAARSAAELAKATIQAEVQTSEEIKKSKKAAKKAAKTNGKPNSSENVKPGSSKTTGPKTIIKESLKATVNVEDNPVPREKSKDIPPEGNIDQGQRPSQPEEMERDLENGATSLTAADRGIVQPPSFEHHTTNKGKEKEDDLAVAVPVKEQKEKVTQASVVEDKAVVPFYKRSVFWIILLALLVVAGVVIGVTVAVTGDDDSDDPPLPTDPPTPSATPEPTTEEDFLIRLFLQDFTPLDMITFSPLAYESAVRWISDDPLRYTNVSFDLNFTVAGRRETELPEQNLNIQRFILSWLWYHTTNNGEDPWLSCNPPDVANGEELSCNFLQSAYTTPDPVTDQIEVCFTGVPNRTRWMSDSSECDWVGVICDPSSSYVLGLQLYAHGLSGEFPRFLKLMPILQVLEMTYGSMNGTIPGDVTDFPFLISLVLTGNIFTEISDSLFDVPLQNLNLAFNQFNAPIPEAISNLSPTIAQLYLMGSGFRGPLPEGLSAASNLGIIYAYDNPLDATLPASWGQLQQLEDLQLRNSDLIGPIPAEWSGLASMTLLDVRFNQLTGPLPNMETWLGLQNFFVQANFLNGTFPESF